MSYSSIQHSCDIYPPSSTTINDINQWVMDYAELIYSQLSISKSIWDHINELEITAHCNKKDAVNSIAGEIWKYVHWCESRASNEPFIRVQSDSEGDSYDENFFAEIACYFSKKATSQLLLIHTVIEKGRNANLKRSILCKKDGRTRFVPYEDFQELLMKTMFSDESSLASKIL